MDTKVYNVEETGRCQEIFMEAGRVIRSGGLVAFPTETVYGLGGNALVPGHQKKYTLPKEGLLTIR